MGKTYRKEKPASKRREERVSHDKAIDHDHDRTNRKHLLNDIMHHDWSEDDEFDGDE